jgi:hypothetical protein
MLNSLTSNCYLPEWRFLIRKGCPLDIYRNLIFNMYQLNSKTMEASYQNINEHIFLERSNTSIYIFPTFSDNATIDTQMTCLNKKG